ncbi:MAG: hypothetical protein JWP84_3804 [Tardiphaga sp.]|jgi:hypothetical protein|nr:hypothetical protein [Tardiphaga sp.]
MRESNWTPSVIPRRDESASLDGKSLFVVINDLGRTCAPSMPRRARHRPKVGPIIFLIVAIAGLLLLG